MGGIAGISQNRMNYGYNKIGAKNDNKLSNKLSSGKRINSAADDAAGLAIAKKLEKQARALNMASENTKMGIGALNVGDGAMSGIMDYLQDIRDVSIRAMNGTYSDSDRQAMQQEINGYLDGIQQMAKGTQFNTHTLLDGNMATMDIATNPDGTGMKIQMADSTLAGLGIAGYSVTGDFDISAIDNAISKVSEARSNMGISTNALEHMLSYNNSAAEHQTASQSRIEDLDMAGAISEQKKNKILQDYRMMLQKRQMQQGNMVVKMFS